CRAGEEQFCDQSVMTYGGIDRGGSAAQGGYSNRVTGDQKVVLRLPDNVPLPQGAAPLSPGRPTWSPVVALQARPRMKVGVIGLGGLGHMAVKLASALGCEVSVISTSDRKKADAKRLGATDFIVSRDAAQMQAAKGRFELILNSVSAAPEINSQLSLL